MAEVRAAEEQVEIGVCDVGVEDASELARLHGRSFARGWSRFEFEALLADPACLALAARAAGGSAFQGFVLARAAADEAEILSIAVVAGARRGGLAFALIARLRQVLASRGVRRLILEVGEGNTGACALYRKHGFRVIGRRRGYYRSAHDVAGEDAIVMELGFARRRRRHDVRDT